MHGRPARRRLAGAPHELPVQLVAGREASPREPFDLGARAGQRRVPIGRVDRRLRRDVPGGDRSDGRAEVDAAPAEVRRPLLVAGQRRVGARVGHAGAFGVGSEHALGGLLEQLARLVGAQRDAVVEAGADDEPGRARGLARVDRAGRPLHRDRALAAVLRRVGAAEERAHRHVGAETRRLAGQPAEFLRPAPTGSILRPARRCRAPCPGSASRGRSWPGSCDRPCSGRRRRRSARRRGRRRTARPPRRTPSDRGCRSRPRSPSRRCRSRR